MRSYVGLDVSQATTAICVVDEDGRTLAEGKVPIAAFVRTQAPELIRIGLETGPLAVWLFGALRQDGLPVICLDARHAAAGLALMANKTDRNDAAGVAQIVRTGWFRQVHVRSEASYIVRARLAARTTLVRQRCEVDNQIRGLLKTFGILVGKAPGGLRKRAAEIAGDELANQPELAQLVRMLLALRETLCDQIAQLDRQLTRQAKTIPVCRRFMTVPGVGVVVALSVWAAIDDPGRFAKSPSLWGLSWPHPAPLCLRRGRSPGPHHQARRPCRPYPSVRGRQRAADAHRPLLGTQGMGPQDREAQRLQEGQGGRRPQAGRHPASDLA